MIELVEVQKSYGGARALKGVSLKVEKGEFVGIVGPNGAGKSTLLRIMVGVERPSSGKVLIESREPTSEDWTRFRKKVGFMPERVSFYDNLTGFETVLFFARVKGYGTREVERVLSLGLLTEEDLKRKVGEYSKGMKQRINIMQALLGPPEILVMDEPTSGLDPRGVIKFFEIVEELKKNGTTVLMSTHVVSEIEERADRIVIMRDGGVVAEGAPEEIFLTMPVRFVVKVRDGVEDLQEVVKKSGATDVVRKGNFLIAEVPPEKKMEFLKVLMEQEDTIEDISMREPSLEEVILGGE